MKEFFAEVMWNSIEQIIKSERERKKEADTSENIESLNVDETFLEVLNLAKEIKSQCEEGKLSKKSRKKISAIEDKMNNLFQNVTTSTEVEFDNIIVLVIAHSNLSDAYMITKYNLYAAKDHLEKCMELLKGRELHPKAILISIHILIQLNIIWRELEQLENCYPLLDKATELYLNYTKEENEYPAPFNINIFIEMVKVDEVEIKIEDTKIYLPLYHKVILNYIEELYWIQPIDKHKFVIYVNNLLNQQLNKAITSTENKVSLLHWAKASADLCNYFLHHNRLIEMKAHLAAAHYMIARYGTLKDQASGSSEHDVFEEVQANIARYWGIYGLKLLYLSIERLWYQSDKSCEPDNIKSEFLAKSEEGLMKPLIFIELEKDLENIVEITDTYVSNLDEAKAVFINVLKWFDTAKSYFSVENNFVYYVDTILNICKAYKYYAYFEQNKSKRIKIIKQQIKILENTVTSYITRFRNKTHVDYYYRKSIYFELAILYSTLLDVKSEELENFELTDDMKMEIRQLVESVLHNFNNFSLII